MCEYTDPSRMYATRSDASSGVVGRQQTINGNYNKLLTLAKVRMYMHPCFCILDHFINQVQASQRGHAWFLEITFSVRVYACVLVCMPPWP